MVLFKQSVFLILLSLLISIRSSQSKNLSLPQNDANPQRQLQIDEIAAAIKTESRFHIVNNVTYPIPPGPIPRSGALVLNFMAVEQQLFELNANPNQHQIKQIAADSKINSLADYAKIYKKMKPLMETPQTSGANDDISFGADRTTIKPGNLKLLQGFGSFPKQFNARTAARKICGYSAVRLVRRRRVFTLNLSFVGKYNDRDASFKHAPSSTSYFCVNRKKQLVSFAIFIIDTKLIYTPFDSKNEWQLAKMAVNAAESNIQPMDHFLETHVMLEPVRIEMMRALSTSHPIYALLEHHFTQLYFNTPVALRILFSAGTTFDKIFGWGASGALKYLYDRSQETSFEDTFEEKILKNGLDYLPNHKFRDDGRILLSAIRKFLSEYLSTYYRTNKHVTDDHELQTWAKQVSQVSPGFPDQFSTRPQVVRIVGDLIFRVSVQHHAYNSDVQWHVLSFPYSLPSLFAPMPTKKGVSIDLLKYVVPKPLIPDSLSAFSSFIRFKSWNQTLEGSYSIVDLGDRAEKAVSNHEARMKQIGKAIAERERFNTRPYTFLIPSRLPYYVWV